MTLKTKDFETLVNEQATAIQGASTGALVDFSVGSILRAVVESYSAVALWLQALILKLLSTTRASTSAGPDLASWMGDFGLMRLPSVGASGLVRFARFTSGASAIVPVGALVQTTDGTQKYAVALDITHPAYSAAQGGYVIAAGAPSIDLTVTATVPGSAGNAAIGRVNTLGQAMPGIDTVTNIAAFLNGADPESDDAFRARFVQWINSLAEGTLAAVQAAVARVQQGLSFKILENTQYNGTRQPGYFTIVVDNGSGAPTAALLAAVRASVEPIRPLCSTFGVYGPTTTGVDVSVNIMVDAAYGKTVIADIVRTAIQNHINTLAIGEPLLYTRIAQVAYDASPAVTRVFQGYTINGGTSDVLAAGVMLLKAGTVTVT